MAEMPTFFSSMSHLPPLVAAAAQRTDAAAARMTRISWLHIVLEIDLQEIVVCMLIRFFVLTTLCLVVYLIVNGSGGVCLKYLSVVHVNESDLDQI